VAVPTGSAAFYVAVSFHVVPDTIIEHALPVWRFLVILSPLTALFLGLRGALPGTKPSSPVASTPTAVPLILGLMVAVIGAVFGFGSWVAFKEPQY
jgi:hypothetical protein